MSYLKTYQKHPIQNRKRNDKLVEKYLKEMNKDLTGLIQQIVFYINKENIHGQTEKPDIQFLGETQVYNEIHEKRLISRLFRKRQMSTMRPFLPRVLIISTANQVEVGCPRMGRGKLLRSLSKEPAPGKQSWLTAPATHPPHTSPSLPVSKFLLLREILVGDSPAPTPNFRRIRQPTETLIRSFLLLPSWMSEAFSGTKLTQEATQALSSTASGSANEHHLLESVNNWMRTLPHAIG